MWTWHEGYPKKVYMSHDGHVFYSKTGNSDSNQQNANLKQIVVEKSFAVWKLFEYLQSSTQTELTA